MSENKSGSGSGRKVHGGQRTRAQEAQRGQKGQQGQGLTVTPKEAPPPPPPPPGKSS